jgi:hypothetical protein
MGLFGSDSSSSADTTVTTLTSGTQVGGKIGGVNILNKGKSGNRNVYNFQQGADSEDFNQLANQLSSGINTLGTTTLQREFQNFSSLFASRIDQNTPSQGNVITPGAAGGVGPTSDVPAAGGSDMYTLIGLGIAVITLFIMLKDS